MVIDDFERSGSAPSADRRAVGPFFMNLVDPRVDDRCRAAVESYAPSHALGRRRVYIKPLKDELVRIISRAFHRLRAERNQLIAKAVIRRHGDFQTDQSIMMGS